MPTISVVIPTYNAEKTIAETIQSVLDQTYVDFEVLIINDGSSDRTLEVIGQFQDPRIQVFSYPNSGHAASRNRGIAKALGGYISFLDADDLWQPQKLAAQWQALQDHPAASVAYSWSDFIDENGKFLHQGSYFSATGNVYAQLFVKNFIENGSNPLIRKPVFAEVGEFDQEMPACVDWDMWLRIAKNHEFICVPEPQILYRVSLHSVSSNLGKVEAMAVKVIQKNLVESPQSLQHLKRASLANLYLYLTFRAFNTVSSLSKNLMTARYLFLAIIYDLELLKKRSHLIGIVVIKMLKSLFQLIFGVQTTEILIQNFRSIKAS